MRAFVVTKYKEPLQEADVPEPVVAASTMSWCGWTQQG
jgi:hypothetical protein